jgi:hypothetical protein
VDVVHGTAEVYATEENRRRVELHFCGVPAVYISSVGSQGHHLFPMFIDRYSDLAL